MAQVPGYNPVPQVQPFERPVPLPEPSIPESAFGTGVAKAAEAFGVDATKFGTEMGDRALGLREMQIETAIRDKTNDTFRKATDLQSKYLALQGQNAVDAQPGHLQTLDALYQDGRKAAAQYGAFGTKMYDDQASTLFRSYTREVAQHSGRQLQVSTDKSIDAEIGTLQERLAAATDPTLRTSLINDITAAEQRRGDIWGYDQQTRDYNANNAVSRGIAKNTFSQIQNDPLNATTIAQKAQDEGRMNQEDADQVQKRAAGVAATIGPHAWYDGLRTGTNISLGEQKVDPDRLTQAIIYDNEGGLRRGTAFRDPRTHRVRQALDGGIMPESLPGFLKDAGLPSMTPEQYQAQTDQWKYNFIKGILTRAQDQYGNANDAAVYYFTGKPLTPESVQRRDPFHGVPWYLQTFNQALAGNASQKEIGEAARRYGQSVATRAIPDAGELYRTAVVDRQDADERRDRFQKYDVDNQIGTAIRNNPETNKPYESYSEFAASPQNQQLIQQGQSVFPDFEARTSRAIAGLNRAFMATTDIAHKADITKLMTGDQDEKQKFMEGNYWGDSKLSAKDQIYFAQQKERMLRQGFVDPNVGHAYEYLANRFRSTDVDSHGEVPGKTTDPQGFADYKYRLFTAMQGWEEKEKRPLILGTPEGNKVLEEIHQWLAHKTPSGLFGLGRGTPEYEEEPNITDDYTKAVRSENPNATDADVRYLFLKEQSEKYFDNLYGAQAKKPFREQIFRTAAQRNPTVNASPVSTTVPPPPPTVPTVGRGLTRAGSFTPPNFPTIQSIVQAVGTPEEGAVSGAQAQPVLETVQQQYRAGAAAHAQEEEQRKARTAKPIEEATK